jgi:hypothetical protein
MEANEHFSEAKQCSIGSTKTPIEPANLIILTVAVTVPLLGSPHLVSHQKQRRAKGKEGQSQGISDLAISQLLYRRVLRRALCSAIPRQFVGVAAPILLKVRFVMFVIVGHEIIQREPIVTSREVHALLRRIFSFFIEVRAPEEALPEAYNLARVAFDKALKVIAKFSVPFLPSVPDK